MRFKEKFYRFMIGRNGTDDFARFTIVLGVVLLLLSMIGGSGTVFSTICWLAAIAALVVCYLRIFSRNIEKRRKENQWYLKKRYAFLRWLRSLRDRWQQRKEYRFFRCPSCHTLLRVPKGKGRLQLTCRKCGHRFVKKT